MIHRRKAKAGVMPEKKRRVENPSTRDKHGNPQQSGGGAATGRSAPPPRTPPQQPDAPKEVNTIPIGVPDSEQSYRDRKERARRPGFDDDPACADDEKEQ